MVYLNFLWFWLFPPDLYESIKDCPYEFKLSAKCGNYVIFSCPEDLGPGVLLDTNSEQVDQLGCLMENGEWR